MNFKLYSQRIILIFIILFGSFVRLYKLKEFLPWFGDGARDVLVAKHMVEMGDNIFIAPFTVGGSGLINNSPVYYWIISLFWLLTRSPEGIAFCFSLLGILLIYISYRIGVLTGNRLSGLTSAFWLSMSSPFINYSRTVFQPFLLPFITGLSVFSLIKYIKSRSMVYLNVFIIVIFIGLHIHYAFFPIFLTGTIWIFYFIFNLIKKRSSAVLLPVTLFLINFLIFINLTFINKPFDQLYFFTDLIRKWRINDLSQIVTNLNSVYSQLFTSAIPFEIIFIFLLILLILTLKHLKTVELLIFASFFLSILLVVNYQIKQIFYYYIPYHLIIILTLSYVINKHLKNMLLKIILVILITVIIRRDPYYLNAAQPKYFDMTGRISNYIYTDYVRNRKTSSNNSFIILTDLSDDASLDWHSAAYWYFLEEKTGKKLIKLLKEPNNFQLLINKPEIYYLICMLPRYTACNTLKFYEFYPEEKNKFPKLIFSKTSINIIFYLYRFS